MAVFDVLNPLANTTPRFTEEQLTEIVEWFDEHAKPLLVINEADNPTNVITIEQLQNYLGLKKFHRRSFYCPTYAEIMLEAEYLHAGLTRMLTMDQFIYILDTCVREPDMKHELKLAFKVFDTEKRGFLEIDELREIITSIGDLFDGPEVTELLRDANVRGDGNIFYEDFVESIFTIAPELYQLKKEYLYDDADEDPSVPPLPPEPEPEPELPPPTPPPPPPPAKKDKKEKGAKKKK